MKPRNDEQKLTQAPSEAKTLRFKRVKLCVLALVALVSTPPGALGQEGLPVPSEPFVVLLAGIYEPVAYGPDLGLSQVDLSDGSFVKTRIYRVSGLPGTSDQAVGTYYDNFVDVDAYQLPGGAISATYLEFIIDETVEIDGEVYDIGTAELVIMEATGVYRSWVGGEIHMEFATRLILDELGDVVGFDENCLCFISR
jgi:hypothetical protein